VSPRAQLVVNTPVLLRFQLGSPRCDTVLFNAKVRLTDSYNRCDNNVVHAFGS